MSPIIRETKIKAKINHLMYMKMTAIKIATEKASHGKEMERSQSYILLVNMKW